MPSAPSRLGLPSSQGLRRLYANGGSLSLRRLAARRSPLSPFRQEPIISTVGTLSEERAGGRMRASRRRDDGRASSAWPELLRREPAVGLERGPRVRRGGRGRQPRYSRPRGQASLHQVVDREGPGRGAGREPHSILLHSGDGSRVGSGSRRSGRRSARVAPGLRGRARRSAVPSRRGGSPWRVGWRSRLRGSLAPTA